MLDTMLAADRQIWSGMLNHLKTTHPGLCRQWFEEIEPLGILGGVLRLRAHSNVHRDYLQRQCADSFNDAATTVSQRLLTAQFFGPTDYVERAPADEPGPRSTAQVEIKPAGARPAEAAPPTWPLSSVQKRPDETLVINPDYGFENFVVGPGNRLAHAAALAVSDSPGSYYNPYFVHGGVGLGKTHLLQAICLKVHETNPAARIFYTSCEGFMTQLLDSVQAGAMAAFHHRFRDVDMLVIDDIHFLTKRDRSQEEFFHTFNSLYQSKKQIILSSDAAPDDIPDLQDRLVSRFKCGLVTTVSPPDYETRIAIIKNKALLRGLSLPDDVAAHIAARIDTNIRELEGAVVKIQVLANLEQKPIDLTMAAAALGEPLNVSRGDRQIQIQTIIAAVTEFFNVKVTDLQSKRRQRSIALPRQVCMYLARRYTRFSLEEIGGYFGGRDHTTVMHAVRTIEGRRETDQDFAKSVTALESQLRGAL